MTNRAPRWQRLKSWLSRAVPRQATWVAMGKVWRFSAALLILILTLTLGWQTVGLEGWLGVFAIMGLLLLAALAAWLTVRLLAKLPSGALGGLLLLAVPLIPVAPFSLKMLAALYLVLALTLGLIATGLNRYREQRKVSGGLLVVGGALPLAAALIAFLVTGWNAETPIDWQPMSGQPLQLPNPGAPGPEAVQTFSYGSGRDRHRDEFADGADWQSRSVDGSKLIDGWEGLVGWARTGFWGFDATELPVQGRVWMPEGAGPFPLVLIVHGNHEGADFSDTGYGYLAERMASRGVIAVSVDENFLNSYMGDLLGGPEGSLEEESDARAWMLLQHLVQWREWSADPAHPMHGKADLERVVLIGHSRGGEAVSEAAVFNRLPRYPDDGTLEFDFGFGLKGIIAIAPVDHQYNPRDLPTPLKDINLLVIHGSHDADVDAFAGSAMYSRLKFEQCGDCFKSSFYLLNANHGQFNTSWGIYDPGLPAGLLLNVNSLLAPDLQEETANVLFNAFLSVTLFDQESYRAFLASPERGSHWLPHGIHYLSNYADTRFIRLADFEEDADLTTAGKTVASVSGIDLAIWKEAEVPLRWRDTDSAAVLLGWGGEAGADPAYEIELPDGGLAVRPDMTLSFSAAMGAKGPKAVEDFEVPAELDFSIELFDSAGRAASVPLSSRRPLYPQVNPVIYKLEALSDEAETEPTFQRYAFRFGEWRSRNPELDLNAIRTIRFVFPQDVPASVWLDDIAIVPGDL